MKLVFELVSWEAGLGWESGAGFSFRNWAGADGAGAGAGRSGLGGGSFATVGGPNSLGWTGT